MRDGGGRMSILDLRPTGRCSRPLEGWCRCWRPRGHDGPCRCTCVTYGMEHGVNVVTLGQHA